MAGPDPSAAHLAARLRIIEGRIGAAVERRRAVDPDPGDRFRGLYITDEQVDDLLVRGMTGWGSGGEGVPGDGLSAAEALADAAEGAGDVPRLRRVARTFGLAGIDIDLLLVALAPDLDPRFERLYGYLHDDVSRRRASTGLALELAGHPGLTTAGAARARLGFHGPLVAGGLLLVEDPDRPFLTRSLRVPDRVTAHLLGDDAPDPLVAALRTETVAVDLPEVAVLARGLTAGLPLAYLRERAGASGRSLGATALGTLGRAAVVLDLTRLAASDDPATVAAAASREARLAGGGLVVGPVEVLAERGPGAVRAMAELPGPVILVGSRGWDPAWSVVPPLMLDVPVPDVGVRHELWMRSLDTDVPADFDPAVATIAFRLAPEQIDRAARAARASSTAEGRPMTADDVAAGARAQNAAGLDRLARRIVPSVAWEDLVLPPVVEQQLRELTARARHRERVVGDWRMGTKGARGLGITGLFAGDSGTGKTMSAEVLAGDLGFDVYVIDLSTVVDKYIGETEKNLDRIFTEADRVNGILLFDEADALFGKRSEVKDARDRYANVEVAYLLQRMERFDGLAILTTNLRANVDEAFVRRLDAIVDFPMPEEEYRLRLWERNLGPELPVTGDLDLAFLARRFRISGGNIRNVCVTAAYLAAADGRRVSMVDLVRATEREYRKLGRLTVEAEFGEYFPLVGG
ncbi:MAG TPA: ATP-binding protein [Candidatus Limnocylindrales bacterium]|nr:ATP-binding protein [Candidatus Limnocylindrales bacterium]